jgi:Tfp pilus assembly protein PilX
MKQLLQVLGVIFIAILVLGGIFTAYSVRYGRQQAELGIVYFEETAPKILSTMSKDELLKYASPALVKLLNSDTDKSVVVFNKILSSVGQFQSMAEAKVVGSQAGYNFKDGQVVTASYSADAKFAIGPAVVVATLVKSAGHEWQFQYFGLQQ